MKEEIVLLIYGEGGHKKEMELFLASLPEKHQLKFVTMGPSPLMPKTFTHFQSKDARDKNSHRSSLIKASLSIYNAIRISLVLRARFKVKGAISTGPGIALLPFLIFRLFGAKTVFIETFCRFTSRSITGRIMYLIASRFLVQNKEQLALYPKAEYSGRL
jgi:UDP-N-acetylglucosamine:LPS N-acetylglucosamine transferase